MERKHINPPELFKHPSYTRVITITGPSKLIFIAGQTPSDEKYRPIAIGDMRAQYLRVMEALTVQLQAAGATWDDVVYRRLFVLAVGTRRMELTDCLPRPSCRECPSPR